MAFIRSYADMAGDVPPKAKRPSHTPAAHTTAPTHTRSKKAKRATRVAPAARGSAKDIIDAIGANLPIVGAGIARLPGVASQLGHGGGGGRRKRNFANVRALRRALGRVEGFERIVKSVERAYPRLKRATQHPRHHFAAKSKRR